MRMHPGQIEIEIEAVRAAVADQIVGARGLPVVAVASAGTVVAPFRIGDGLVARVPLVPQDADARARLLAEGEHARRLAASLPLEVSQLVAIGEAFPGYDGVWSVWTWVEGASLDALTPDASADLDRGRLAADLAAVLRAFHALPTGGAGWGGAAGAAARSPTPTGCGPRSGAAPTCSTRTRPPRPGSGRCGRRRSRAHPGRSTVTRFRGIW
ncbi:phosphotransferase [Propioniciclava coleopterorum]|uniref:Phosphotransferase n=1 Tax=Propioniciclava coleopterorum TaxID=2714937 RepID=A0A6G7Y3K9_9ACTN|nr:phosphotransferase [Propioniciclava coleopterorum]QIK71266.1 phosphotransferase [Propioniciclava coleopterorum]